MKLNTDCIRDILIAVESIPYGSIWTMDNIEEVLPDYTSEELEYHLIKLHEAGYLDIVTLQLLGSPLQVARIKDLTYEGHQFLADIRSDTTWNKTKEIAKSVGSTSLHSIKEIATGVITSLIQNQLGLH